MISLMSISCWAFKVLSTAHQKLKSGGKNARFQMDKWFVVRPVHWLLLKSKNVAGWGDYGEVVLCWSGVFLQCLNWVCGVRRRHVAQYPMVWLDAKNAIFSKFLSRNALTKSAGSSTRKTWWMQPDTAEWWLRCPLSSSSYRMVCQNAAFHLICSEFKLFDTILVHHFPLSLYLSIASWLAALRYSGCCLGN